MSYIFIEEKNKEPKYKQIVASIELGITNGSLKRGDKLPSINAIREEFKVSRDTVLLGYNELKTRGIIQSVAGKGYYIKNENISVKQKVFLLFDEFNSFKEDLYNSFINAIDDNIMVDIFFHHFNYDVFSKLIYDNTGNYHSYIIMPANLKDTGIVVEKLPFERVCILDQINEDLLDYKSIYQNFEQDIYTSLSKGLALLKKYQSLILFQDKKQPLGMQKGFISFCENFNFDYQILDDLKERTPKKGEVYIIPDDKNLIRIIQKIKKSPLSLSKDIGLIAYNDNLLKEVVEGGITTITTDFIAMGTKLAELLNSKKALKIENTCKFIKRDSL
ncbi:MAG: GntR family transcriptional regulator [Tenacibaculum sp.]